MNNHGNTRKPALVVPVKHLILINVQCEDASIFQSDSVFIVKFFYLKTKKQ